MPNEVPTLSLHVVDDCLWVLINADAINFDFANPVFPLCKNGLVVAHWHLAGRAPGGSEVEHEELAVGLVRRDRSLVVCLGLELFDATAETQHQMEGRLLLNVVVLEGAAVFELLAGEDKALLVRRDAFLVLNLGPANVMWLIQDYSLFGHLLDVLDGVALLNIEGDGLSSQGLHEDLHAFLG